MTPELALQWAHPWAWTTAALAFVPGAVRWLEGRAGPAAGYADAAMRSWAVRESGARRTSGHALLEAAVWLLLAAALAGPRQLRVVDSSGLARSQHRIDLLVLLEVPASASGGDAALDARRLALQQLQQRLRGERLGLMVYSAGVGLLLPCTRDDALFDAALGRVRPAMLQGVRGPGLAGALALARRELQREPGPSRALLLLAGPSASGAPGAAVPARLRRQAAALRAARIAVFLAWSGAGEPGPQLASLLARGAGATARLGRPGVWSRLYDHGIARLPSNPPQPDMELAWRELYAVPLSGALLLLLVAEWMRRRRGGAGTPRAPHVGSWAGAMVLGASCAWGALPAPNARADEVASPWRAWQAWRHADYRACAGLYAAQAGYDARLGEGDCEYREGRYAQALASFRRAMLVAADDRRRAVALYNLGNAAFHVPGGLREALDAYRASLVLQPGTPAVRHNLRLAQAQWTQEHPEYEIVGMRKRGVPMSPAPFGDTSDTAPSQQRHADRQRPQAYANQRLQAGGMLRADAADAAGATPARRRVTLSAADVAAARRGMRLLHDRRAMLLDGWIERDSREAADLARTP
jgi:tetratricopeptide (TPR) repeat protein